MTTLGTWSIQRAYSIVKFWVIVSFTGLFESISMGVRFVLTVIGMWISAWIVGLFCIFLSYLAPEQVVAPILNLVGLIWSAKWVCAAFIAFGPLVAAGIASALPLISTRTGSWFTKKTVGAKDLSARELRNVKTAIALVMARAPQGTPEPKLVFVLRRRIDLNAYAIGDTIYLTEALVSSPYLPALLAHALGHIRAEDSITIHSSRYFVIPPAYWLWGKHGMLAPGARERHSFMKALPIATVVGGIGILMMNGAWSSYWRSREFVADEFAFQCGVGNLLIDYLNTYPYQGSDIAIPFFFGDLLDNEERIDQLMLLQQIHQQTNP